MKRTRLISGLRCCLVAVVAMGLPDFGVAEMTPAARAAIADAMARVREDKGMFIDKQLLKDETPEGILKEMEPYLRDLNFRAQRAAFAAVSELLSAETVPMELRRRAVREILKAASERGDGMWGEGTKYVTRFFSASDYDEDAKKVIMEVLRTERYPTLTTLRTVSAVHIKEALPEVKRKLEIVQAEGREQGTEWYHKTEWTIRKVMAQFGDEESIRYCVTMIDAESDITRKSGLLYQLGRIRHPLVVDLLRKYLQDDTVYNNGQQTRGISWDAARPLWQMLEGFPPKAASEYGTYAEEDIPKCRKWMAEQTEWKFKEF